MLTPSLPRYIPLLCNHEYEFFFGGNWINTQMNNEINLLE
jgi:hypothetical protein